MSPSIRVWSLPSSIGSNRDSVSNGSSGEAAVRRLLDAAGIRPSKRLGQNFLVDPNVVAAIVEAVEADARSGVVEIGPGLGALTFPLAGRAQRLTAVEVDRRLAGRLGEALASQADTVEVVEGDILGFDFTATAAAWRERIAVVGAIPYSITAPILKKLIDARAAIRVAYLVTQREVAEKIQASPGRAGTALGILVQSYTEVSILRRIPRGAFFPVPDVDSCLWKMSMLDTPRFAASEERFFAVVRAIYGARRKTLRNALQRGFLATDVDALLARSGVDPKVRGETLGFRELDELAKASESLPCLTTTHGDADDSTLDSR
jgi:16S rRNA (adenine1518-N6/adenine1519-N6)-dimethyltransferase